MLCMTGGKEREIKLCMNPLTGGPGLHTALAYVLLLPRGEGAQLNVPSVRHMPKAYILFKF